jgi:hypothetical protein
MRLLRCCCSISQVVFSVSHTSVVRLPRTARAFSRAARRQLAIEDGLSGSPTMKSITSFWVSAPYLASNCDCSSDTPSIVRQPCCSAWADCGISEYWTRTSSMRAVFSARSV